MLNKPTNDQDQIGENERQDMVSKLTLPLLDSSTPFALEGKELTFGPDDWAWLFLRLNQGYKIAYEKREPIAETQPALSTHCDPSDPNITFDSAGTCNRTFGLAAWLNPDCKTLPRLSAGGSWFFPLKCPVSEDYYRLDVSNDLYVRDSRRPLPGVTPYQHVVANETPFGYMPPRLPFLRNSGDHTEWGLVWVAVDCSIPPDGQMTAVEDLAHKCRNYLMDYGFITHDRLAPLDLELVQNTDAFRHMRFAKSAAASHESFDHADLWSAVAIDVLGPIASQAKNYLDLLKARHKKLLKDELAWTPRADRFKNELPSEKDSKGERRHGGSYLKALIVIAELNKIGLSPNQIAAVTIASGPGANAPNWKKNFHDNIEQYLDDAKALINSEYRWLIHSQKPDR